jgi:hypothetical protein
MHKSTCITILIVFVLSFSLFILIAQEKSQPPLKDTGRVENQSTVKNSKGIPLTLSTEDARDLYSVELNLSTKTLFVGQPFYYQVVVKRLFESAPGKEFRSSCNIYIANESETLESLQPMFGRFSPVSRQELHTIGASHDVALKHSNNSVHVNDLKATGVFYLTAACSILSADFPQTTGKFKSAPIAITIREPTESERIALALITENFSKLQHHFHTSPKTFDEAYYRTENVILNECAVKCRELLKDPNLPLRKELSVHLSDLLEQLLSSRYLDKLERNVLLKERLTLLVQFPEENLSIDERYLQWAAYFGSDWTAESPPTKFMNQLGQIIKQPASVEFDWRLMERQWRAELPILPQTCELDIEQVYAPTKKLIEKLAAMQN